MAVLTPVAPLPDLSRVSALARPLVEEAFKSLVRVKSFDADTLPRKEELGSLNFEAAVAPANRLLTLYRRIDEEVLPELAPTLLQQLTAQANGHFNQLNQIATVALMDQQNPKSHRDVLVSGLEQQYEPAFMALLPCISYSLGRATDFDSLQFEARVAAQEMKDRSAGLAAEMQVLKSDAEGVLATVKKVAAEQGVSQQAIYFKTEAEGHSTQAQHWLRWTQGLTAALVAFAALSFFLHRIPIIAPENSFEAVQLSISKVLVFVTLASFLLLAARNFNAHRHNAIVNKHRQNSLVTYEALVKAASAEASRDIVLTRAAESIFNPQPTGFTKADGNDGGGLNVVALGNSLLKPSSGTP
jgi:uncharacterized membrane protein YidH (DUF202 family)